jgi:hypothetical protein
MEVFWFFFSKKNFFLKKEAKISIHQGIAMPGIAMRGCGEKSAGGLAPASPIRRRSPG